MATTTTKPKTTKKTTTRTRTKQLALPPASDISLLKKLRWVADAKANGAESYLVQTKAGVFHTVLTHKVIAGYSQYDSSFAQGSKLEKTVNIPLPSYWIELNRLGFRFSLAEKPKPVTTSFGMIPQYEGLTDIGSWNVFRAPCYGNGIGDDPKTRSTKYDYQEAKTWVDKAFVAVIYLQSAEPHYGETWYCTSWAYRLGLVGDEYRDDKPQPGAVTAGPTESN